MKTITEFSGVLLQRAAEVQRAFREANPQVAAPAVEQVPPSAESADPAAADAEAAAPVELPAEAAAPVELPAEAAALAELPAEAGSAADGVEEASAAESAPADAGGAAETPPAEEVAPPDLGTGPEAEAVGAALDVQGDRLSRLMEALDVAGRRAGQVRLVRVLQGETPPQGAQKRGDYYYAVDLAPRPQSQQRDAFEGRDGDRRRGPGGRDRGGRPGDRGPGGARGAGGPPGKGGKFSNDRPSRDGDMREGRGEVPRAGAGWTLTRAPEDRRVRSDEPGADRRDRRPPPRGPRFDGRGPRPPMGATGDRPPRGPRPDRAGGRPPYSGPRPQGGPGERPPMSARPEGRAAGPSGPPNGRRGPGPMRPDGAGGPRRDDRNWSGRRRGGWDEPAVPEAPEVAAAHAPEATAAIENPPAPATEATATEPAENGAPPSSTDNGS
jgi:hypothetical protein